MDANQDTAQNPFGMDEECTNCPALCETRQSVLHGYGDVSADFVFVGERPAAGADAAGVPFVGDPEGERLQDILTALEFSSSEASDPDLTNAYLTYLTRCRHPDRPPSDQEVQNCEAFLDAELRMINPELIVPIGERTLTALATDYTTRQPDDFSLPRDHAQTVRGRGFELVPMVELGEQTDEQTQAFVEHVRQNVFRRDYRQTKGRRGR